MRENLDRGAHAREAEELRRLMSSEREGQMNFVTID
jgi:hypothetical protein